MLFPQPVRPHTPTRRPKKFKGKQINNKMDFPINFQLFHAIYLLISSSIRLAERHDAASKSKFITVQYSMLRYSKVWYSIE